LRVPRVRLALVLPLAELFPSNLVRTLIFNN